MSHLRVPFLQSGLGENIQLHPTQQQVIISSADMTEGDDDVPQDMTIQGADDIGGQGDHTAHLSHRVRPDPPENWHLNVKNCQKLDNFFKKKLPKIFFFFFKKIANGNFFEKNDKFCQFF